MIEAGVEIGQYGVCKGTDGSDAALLKQGGKPQSMSVCIFKLLQTFGFLLSVLLKLA